MKKKKLNKKLDKYYDHVIAEKWEDTINDINDFHNIILKADKKDKKKKRKNNNKITFHNFKESNGYKARMSISTLFKDNRFIDSILYCFTHAGSFTKMIKKAVSLLIIVITNIPMIKERITDNILTKLDLVMSYVTA